MSLTPAMQQYHRIKKEYEDCILMFRMGDFYEMFYDDAKTAADVLDITLTKRSFRDRKIPLAGVPYHSVEPYIAKFIKQGYKLAICEQVEDPKQAKGVVKREVVRVITPGTIMETDALDAKSNNYIMSVYAYGDKYGIGIVDISTGEFVATDARGDDELFSLIAMYAPSEIIIPISLFVNEELVKSLKDKAFVNELEDTYFKLDSAVENLKEQLKVESLDGYGLTDKLVVSASGALLSYLKETQKGSLEFINKVRYITRKKHLVLDDTTLRNLEIVKNIRDGSRKGTLLWVLDKTQTSMGSRLLQRWIKQPLNNLDVINARLDAVEELINKTIVRKDLQALLKQCQDVERLISKISYGKCNARDLVGLKNSLRLVPLIKKELGKCKSKLLTILYKMPELKEVFNLIDNAIKDEPSVLLTDGNMIKKGYNKELDELHDIRLHGKNYIKALERQERAKTGIKNLKVKYNKVFGYFIEVTKANLPLVPKDYVRKQTLVNAERYITDELKEKEDMILNAEEKIIELEKGLFEQIVEEVAENTKQVQDAARRIANLDVLCNLAHVATNNNYFKPMVNDRTRIKIEGGRHAVLEKMDDFVPNNCILENYEIMIITGPNMSGKCVIGGTIIFTEKGMIPIKHFKPANLARKRFYPLKLKIRSRKGNEHTSHFYYDGKRKTFRITTKFGYTIEGTANHPILVRTVKGEELFKKLSKIQQDDCVIINRRINIWGTAKIVPKKIIKDVRKDDYNGRVKQYILPKRVDRGLVYVMGLLIGDGTLTYKNYLTFTNKDKQLIDEFSRIIGGKFGYSVKTKKNNLDHYISSKQIRFYFEQLGLKYWNSLNKEVPSCILQAPRDIVASFIQGLFDTDGDVAKKYGNVSYSTSSYKLAHQIHLILLNFGIISSLKKRITKVNPSYRVSIYGENAILFHKLIGFKLKRKKQRSKLASKIRMPNYGIPYMRTLLKVIQNRIVRKKDKKIALKRVKKINSIFYTYLPNNRNISYHKLDELIKYCRLNNVECNELIELKDNYYLYDKIEKMEQNNDYQDVYDFSVPNSHSFTANGIINHNSTYMRQNALIIIMAQMGSFVPAAKAEIGLVDRIFTRVGAFDDLTRGQSTFMVEMTETANILNNATNRSFIILDEIGRGTSTFDGVSIAWAVVEYIYKRLKSKTMFATHYHVLNKLAESFENIKNYNIAVKEEEDEVIFLRKIVEGGTDKSYGIHVAKLAGAPREVVERAKEIQAKLEEEDKMLKRIKGKKDVKQTRLRL